MFVTRLSPCLVSRHCGGCLFWGGRSDEGVGQKNVFLIACHARTSYAFGVRRQLVKVRHLTELNVVKVGQILLLFIIYGPVSWPKPQAN